MDTKKQVQEIHYHGVKMGFPPSALPDQQYLEKILRARSTKLFDNFLQRVETQNQTEITRKNILLQVSRCDLKSSRLLSDKFNKFIKLQDLKSKIAKEIKRKEHGKLKENHSLDIIYKNDGLKVKTQRKDELNLLRAKCIDLEEVIEKETEMARVIQSVSPARFSPDCNLEEMNAAFIKSLQLLKNFYSEGATAQSTQLWSDIKNALRSTPNIFIFRSVIKQIAIVDGDNLLQVDLTEDSPASMIENLVTKFQNQLLVCGIELKSKRKHLAMIKSAGSELIKDVAAELELLINEGVEYSFQYEDDDIVEEYMDVVIQHLDLQEKLRHRSLAIAQLKNQNENREYEKTVQELVGFQKKLEDKILNVQQTVVQMYHINEKLNISRISMLHLIQDLKNFSKQQEINRSIMNFSHAPSTGEDSLPTHVDELQTFLKTPIENFNFISSNIACEIGRKICTSDISKTPDGITDDSNKFFDINNSGLRKSLETMRENLVISQKLRAVTNVTKSTKELPLFSSFEKIQQREANRETLLVMLDQIDRLNSLSKSLLKEFQSLYNYLLKNPCKKFLPTKTFDGKTYKDYENDFNLYYKMIKD